MSLYQMPDGNQYEFASDEEATRAMAAWKQQFSEKPKLTPEQISAHMKRAAISSVRGETPVLAGLADFGSGATTMLRGAVGMVSPSLSEKFWPQSVVNKDSGLHLAGQIADPAAFAIGAGGVKAAQMAKSLPIIGSVISKRPVMQGMLGGAIGGAGIGALDPNATAGEVGLMGGVIGGALPVVGKAAGTATDFLQKNSAKLRAKKIIEEVAGDKLPQMRAAWQQAPTDLTAAQAAAGVGSTRMAALGERAATNMSQDFDDIARLQAAARRNEVAKVAGGATQTEARQAAKATKKSLNTITTQMREAAFDPVRQIGKIDTDSLVQKIESSLLKPELAGNRPSELALSSISKEIAKWTEKGGGSIDPAALYSLRKNAVDSAIERFMGSSSDAAKKQAAAGIMKSIKPHVDDAIEQAGGTGWRDYLKTYEQGMDVVNRMKLGARAMELLDSDPKQFLSLVNNNKPKEVSKLFAQTDDFVAAMAEKYAPLKSVATAIERDNELAKRAVAGKSELAVILSKDGVSKFLPNFISAKVAAARKAGDIVEEALNKKTMNTLYAAMRSGKGVEDVLNVIPAKERNQFLSAIYTGKVTPFAIVPTQTLTKDEQ